MATQNIPVETILKGRTSRTRAKKKLSKSRSVKLGCVPEFINLCQWMKCNSWFPVAKLCLATFPDTGRGLMTLAPLKPHDLIVKIPLKLLVTRARVLELLPQLESLQLTTAELLTLFLLHCKESSLNERYLSTLPKEFSIGALCSSEETLNLPHYLRNMLIPAQEYLLTKFRKLKQIWKKIFHLELPMSMFHWAWCSVNTRAVYYKDSHTRQSENNMALAPYLDLLNHDPNAVVKAGFNSKSQCYEIQTLQPIKKYHQVFINYGPHDNFKLFLEYGFIVPGNIHSTVEFGVDYLLSFFPNAIYKMKELISQQSKNLFCQREGFSWDAKLAVAILCSEPAELVQINHPYEINPIQHHLAETKSYQIVAGLLKQFEQHQGDSVHTTSSFSVAKMLLEDTIDILKRALSAVQANDLK